MQTTTPHSNNGSALEASAQKSIAEVRHKMNDLNEQIVAFIKKRPAACLAGAVAAGFIIGRLVSRR